MFLFLQATLVNPKESLFDFIAPFGCYICACYTETFSLSSFECQKHGIPVLRTYKKHPEGPEEYIVQGMSGFSLDTHKMRMNKIRDEMLKLTDQAMSLDRSKIYEHFKNTYTEDFFCASIINQVKSVS